MSPDESTRTITFKGPVQGSKTDALREVVIEALGAHEAVALDLGQASAVDISIVQLIISARAMAERDGKRLWVSQYGYATRNLLERAGLESLLTAPVFEPAVEVGFFFFDEDDA